MSYGVTHVHLYLFLLIICTVSCALLRVGTPLKWCASKPYLAQIRSSGVRQFIDHYNRCSGVTMKDFLWGDEVELGIFSKDKGTGNIDLALSAGSNLQAKLSQDLAIKKLETKPCNMANINTDVGCEWHPEYGSWMIEAVPDQPYNSESISDILSVETSMKLRRKTLNSKLKRDEIAPSMTCFPMMGVPGYAHSSIGLNGLSPISESKLVTDELINPHPRFGALTQNIKFRRGSKVDITVPVDTSPDSPVQLASITSEPSKHNEESVSLDAMAFGMGCCCLQVTMQTQTEDQSRFLHDQLAVLSPILHALSAATPIANGRLLATDTRWNIITQAVDDRTPAERRATPSTRTSFYPSSNIEKIDVATASETPDSQLVGGGVRPLSQSRYSEVPLYISRAYSKEDQEMLDTLNDLDVPIDEESYKALREGGIDHALARHIAHLFVRDPLVIFDDQINQGETSSLDHFENIQSTNWRSMRWKPPALEVGLQRVKQVQSLGELESASMTLHDASDNVLHHSGRQGNNDERKTPSPPRRPPAHTPIIFTSSENTQDNMRIANAMAVDDTLVGEYGWEHGQVGEQVGPGWRVEFRPLEIQLTDFENAAFSIFVVLMSKLILTEGLNLMIPMSYVHENMRRAQLKDAVLTQKFWFRRDLLTSLDSVSVSTDKTVPSLKESIGVVELSIAEILNGFEREKSESNGQPPLQFAGLIPLVALFAERSLPKTREEISPQISCNVKSGCGSIAGNDYDNGSCTPDASAKPPSVSSYLDLLGHRASGALPTTARWMRNFVTRHRSYKRGSGKLTPDVANDLLHVCACIGLENDVNKDNCIRLQIAVGAGEECSSAGNKTSALRGGGGGYRPVDQRNLSSRVSASILCPP